MESLLSLSFDNISSKDPLKIRKGLRQIEGLLAQICLSKGSTSTAPPPPPQSPTKRQTGLLQQQHERRNEDDAKKGLEALAQDLAFREFWRLQENFEWNVATRLVETLDRLLGMRSNPSIDALLVSGLDLVHGLLLLHPKSASLFAREGYMNLLLDLLDPHNTPSLLTSTIQLLILTILSSPRNTRTFEACDGLGTVTSLSKARLNTALHTRVDEFLHVYLLPEMPAAGRDGGDAQTRDGSQGGRSTAEKARVLAPYLGRTVGGADSAGGMGRGGGAGAGALERERDVEVDGMIQGLRNGRALGVVVVV